MILTTRTLIRTLSVAALGTLLVSHAAGAATPESSAKAPSCLQGCGSAELAPNCYYIDQPETGRFGKLVIRRVQECD